MKKKVSLILALLMIASVFVGCAAPAAEAPAPAPEAAAPAAEAEPVTEIAPAEEVTIGGDLVIALGDSPRNFDPLKQTSTWEFNILYNITDSLLAYKIDYSDIVPSLGELKEVSEDGLCYTFTVRDDVYFHPGKFQDGRLMTAHDVAYSLERSAASTAGDALTMLDHCEVVSDTEVKCYLNTPSATFLSMLTSSVNGIVPKEEVEGQGDDFNHNPVGTGPYVFSEYVADQKVVLTKNEKYWQKEPALDSVTYTVITDAAQTANALMTGEIDIALEVDGENIEILGNADEINLIGAPQNGFNFLFFNTKVGACADPLVRQALTMAINCDELIAGMFPFGDAVRNYLPIPYGSWGYDEELESLVPEFNPEAAKELLKGTEYEDGFTVHLHFSGTDARIKMATILQARLKEYLNCTVEFHQTDFATFSATTCAGNAEIGTISWSSWPDPHYFLYNFFHSSAAGTLGGGSGLNNPEIDKLLEEAQLVTDIAERKAIYKDAIAKIMAEYPGLYFASSINHWGIREGVNDIRQRGDGVLFLCNSEVNVSKAN